MTTVPSAYQSLVQEAATGTGLPYAVVAAQANEESGFNANAVSPTGAEGWLQFEPGTYDDWAAKAGVADNTEFNPSDETLVYIQFMKSLLSEFGGSEQDALAAYNAGAGNLSAGMGYANTILSAAGASQNATVGAAGNTPTNATTTSFPGGYFDPLNWPNDIMNLGDAGSSEVTSLIEKVITGFFSDIGNQFLKAFGLTSGKDLLIRIALILLGAFLLFAGVKALLNPGQGPTNIVVQGGQQGVQSIKNRSSSGGAAEVEAAAEA